MPVPASHGAASRSPVTFQGRTVPNLVARTKADGTVVYEFLAKRKGQRTRITLKATSATQAVREVEALRPIARQGRVAQGHVRLADLTEQFLAESRSGLYAPRGKALAASTLALYEQRLDSHVLPALGESRRVREIGAVELRTLIDRMRVAGLSGSTIRGTLAATSSVLRFAVHRGFLDRNPVTDLDGDLPSGERQTEPVYLSRENLDQLLDALGDEFRPVAATCALAGLRISEALGLTWGDLDFGNGEIAVERQLGRDGRSLTDVKTESSKGIVPMPEALAVELQAHRERQGRRGFDRIQPDALLFQTRTGRSPGRRNALRAVQVQADRLGFGNVGLHDLRHSTAGLLRGAGLPEEDITVVLRHANSRVTSQMYGGRSEDARQVVRRRAAEALA